MDLWHFIGSAVCHRMAERSFILGGKTLPLCARCTGIYMGIFLAMAFFFWKKRLGGNKPFGRNVMLFAAFSFLPVSLDGFFSYIGLWESNQLLRVLTGALGGASLPGFLLLGANFDPVGENELPIFETVKEQAFLTAFSVFCGLLVYFGFGFYSLTSVVLSVGVVCFWGGFMYLIVKGIFGKRQLPFWGISFGLGILIIFSVGMVIK